MAQSCGRFTVRHAESLNRRRPPPRPRGRAGAEPTLARFSPLPQRGSSPRWNFQPESISNRSRGASAARAAPAARSSAPHIASAGRRVDHRLKLNRELGDFIAGLSLNVGSGP